MTNAEKMIAAWKNADMSDAALDHPAGMIEISSDDIEGVAGAMSATYTLTFTGDCLG